MLLTAEQHGDIIQTVMQDGHSAVKAVEIADLCNAWAAKNVRCNDCQGGEICSGCKDHNFGDELDTKGYNAERISSDVVRYTLKTECEIEDEGSIDTEMVEVVKEFAKMMKNIRTTVNTMKTEYAEIAKRLASFNGKDSDTEYASLKQVAERAAKKIAMSTELLEKQERQLKQKERELTELHERIDNLETHLKHGVRLCTGSRTVTISDTKTENPNQWQAPYFVPNVTKKAGIDPFRIDRDDCPQSIESSNYLDVSKIKFVNTGGQDAGFSKMPGSN